MVPSAEEDGFCVDRGVEFECFGIGAIVDGIYQHHPWIAKEFLGLEIETGQVLVHKSL